MSLGRLLAAGKSLVGGRDHEGRYRVDKRVALPKFISPRNPFASPAKTDVSSEEIESAIQSRASEPVEAVAKANIGTMGKSDQRISIGTRAARWLGEWRQKLNPLPRVAKQPGLAGSAIPSSTKTPMQTELSLDQVKVVRNDLSDADLEIVPVKAPIASLPAKPEEKFALAGSTWDRLTTKFFGAGPT